MSFVPFMVGKIAVYLYSHGEIAYSADKPFGGAGGVLSPGVKTTGAHGGLSPAAL